MGFETSDSSMTTDAKQNMIDGLFIRACMGYPEG